MSLQLTRFAVYGLHGKFDIDIPILVGVNGLGKTTIVNLIYFLLTEQWGRLVEIEFSSIEVCLNGQNLSVSRNDIQSKNNYSDRILKALARSTDRSPFPRSLIQKVFSHPSFRVILDMTGAEQFSAIRELGRELEIPPSAILSMLNLIPRTVLDDYFKSTKDTPAISELLTALKMSGYQRVIYLPTFRRIEQDLKSIFPNLEEDELRKFASRGANVLKPNIRGYVELVQFGMNDVETKIAQELETISDRTRNQLTNLTASYLKDIISNRADTIKPGLLNRMSNEQVVAVLNRVDEKTLSHEDKQEVRLAIERIRNGSSVQEARDKYLAYFFSRVLGIYLSLYESEVNIRDLIKTCNRYLERKHLSYNEAAFTVNILEADDTTLSWKVLSSGEKQIVSLFTHLYLSGDAEQIVIIDEPELSLSVQWQKSLLPDISDSTSCKLLIAVTHSPFIYANSLDKYAVDLSKFIKLLPNMQS